MTHPHSATRIRLLLTIATGILLLACTVAAWALPQPLVPADPTQPTAADAPAMGDDPCDLVVGAARHYCRPAPSEHGEPVAAGTSRRSTAREQAPWLLLFSSTAIAAAIGLTITARRTSR